MHSLSAVSERGSPFATHQEGYPDCALAPSHDIALAWQQRGDQARRKAVERPSAAPQGRGGGQCESTRRRACIGCSGWRD